MVPNDPNSSTPSLYLPAVNACLAIFRSRGGDPAGVLKVVDSKSSPPVQIVPRRAFDYTDNFVASKKGVPGAPAGQG